MNEELNNEELAERLRLKEKFNLAEKYYDDVLNPSSKYAQTCKSYQIRREFQTSETLRIALDLYGIGKGKTMFFTGTFSNKKKDYSRHDLKQCKEVYKQFCKNLSARLAILGYDFEFCTIWESHKDGAWHYHSLFTFPAHNKDDKPFSSTMFKSIYSDMKKRSKTHLGLVQFKWTFRRSSTPMYKTQAPRTGRDGQKYFEDYTPFNGEVSSYSVANYMTKYICKDLYAESMVNAPKPPKGARLVTYSKHFIRRVNSRFTIHSAYSVSRRDTIKAISRFVFPASFEKFFWYRYKKSKKKHFKHMNDIQHLLELFTEHEHTYVDRTKHMQFEHMYRIILDHANDPDLKEEIDLLEDLESDYKKYYEADQKFLSEKVEKIFPLSLNYVSKNEVIDKIMIHSRNLYSGTVQHLNSLRLIIFELRSEFVPDNIIKYELENYYKTV